MANRLSKQILSLIFIEGAAADWRWRRSSPSSSTRHQHEFRDIVTWVCRSWRSAALSTPEIWARIDVSTPNLSPRVPLYIARTGSTERPVHIHLDANRHFFQETDSDDWEHRSDRLRGTLEEIVNDGCGTELWKTLHLNIVSEVDTWATVFFLNGSAFPNLESFTFIGYQHPRIKLEERLDTLTPIISDPEPDESKLRSVHLKRFSMNFLAECQVGTTVLSRLTCLELELLDSAPSVSQLCQMLSHNPNLKIFRLTLGNDLPKQKPKKQAEDDDGMDVDESVALPLLEELTVDSRAPLDSQRAKRKEILAQLAQILFG
ncbi:hypothetical protein FRC07_010332 [Ceratobasidium sp. 392]|nr:hypothetical protein FRC07_010332 [Ceratobasidium sp. 392]